MWALQAASAFPFGWPRDLHAIEEIAHVERRRVAADFGDRAAGEQARASSSTSLPLSPVSTQPVSPSNRTGHEPSGIQPFSRKISSTPLS